MTYGQQSYSKPSEHSHTCILGRLPPSCLLRGLLFTCFLDENAAGHVGPHTAWPAAWHAQATTGGSSPAVQKSASSAPEGEVLRQKELQAKGSSV